MAVETLTLQPGTGEPVVDSTAKQNSPHRPSRRSFLVSAGLLATEVAVAAITSQPDSHTPLLWNRVVARKNALVEGTTKAIEKLFLPPSAEATGDIVNSGKLILAEGCQFSPRNQDLVSIQAETTRLSLAQIVDMNAPTFLTECGKYAHVAGKPDIKLGNHKYVWVIAYCDEMQGVKTLASDAYFQQDIRSFGVTSTLPAQHFFGFNSTHEVITEPIKLSKKAMSYSHNSEIMDEIVGMKKFNLSYRNGIYHTLAIVLLADQMTYGRLSATGGINSDYGITVLPAELIFNRNRSYAIGTGSHEFMHALGILEHSRNFDNFLYPGIGTNDTDPKIYEVREANMLCGGGQVGLPVTFK